MFFDSRQIFRLKESEVKEVNKLLIYNRDRFENKSHFYRVAVLKLLRDLKTKK